MIAGWVCLIADQENCLELAESAQWSREAAISRARALTANGLASTVLVVKLDPYGGEVVTREATA